MTTPTFNKQTVEKIIHLCSFGIPAGLGQPEPGKMCIEAIISNALDLPHDDKPYECVLPEITKCKIALNDCKWSSPQARAKGMTKLGIAQLGSKDTITEMQFKDKLKLLNTKRILPYLIQKHYEQCKDEKLLEYKQKFEQLVKIDNILWPEFYNYNYYYYNYNYNYYYNYNNYYNYNYNYYYYYYYYNNFYGDEFLFLCADTILQALIELKSPGCEYLHMIPEHLK